VPEARRTAARLVVPEACQRAGWEAGPRRLGAARSDAALGPAAAARHPPRDQVASARYFPRTPAAAARRLPP